MREFKFRAWDKDEEIMIYQNDDCYGFCVTNEGINVVSEEGDWIRSDITQYTGLKDKNGKEIYEGDILRYYSDARMLMYDENNKLVLKGDPHVEERTSVKYDDYFGAFMVHDGSDYLHLYNSKVEVIGNIFENPDLLALEEELQVIEGTPRQSKPLKIISNFKAKTQYIGKIQNSTKTQ